METCDEAINSISVQLEEIEKSLNEQSSQSSNDDGNKLSSLSSDDSDFLPKSYILKSQPIAQTTFDRDSIGALIKKVNNRFECVECYKTFSVLKKCRRHVKKIHSGQNEDSSSSSNESDSKSPTRPQVQGIHSRAREKVKNVDNRFVCVICKKSFSLQKNRRRHIFLKHPEESIYPCGFCDQHFNCKDDLQLHLKRLHPDESLDSNSKHTQQLIGERLDSKPEDSEKALIKKVNNHFECAVCEKTFSLLSDCRRHIKTAHSGQNEDSSSTSNESDYESSNRQQFKRIINKESEKIEKIDNRFVCLICKNSFSMQKNCRRHIIIKHSQETIYPCGFCDLHFSCKDYLYLHLKRKHPGESIGSNFKHIQQLFGDRLYSEPAACSLIECKLCDTNFTTTKELRQHLEQHSDVNTLQSLNLSSNIVQHLFPKVVDLDVVKESICNEICAKDWFKYYTVLNKHFYEMSVSDTEAEDLLLETTERVGKYKCVLCFKEFLYKYQVFSHLKECHNKDEIPMKCSRCKLEFISIKMYKDHKQTHCRNKNKVLHCEKCPAKFVWPENMAKHNCATKVQPENWPTITKDQLKCNICEQEFEERAEYQEHLVTHGNCRTATAKAIIRCGLCPQYFQKLEHLRQHMPMHADGVTGIDFKGCIYVKYFERSKSIDLVPLQLRIQNAYNKSQISCLYQAIDKYGNELDISDSDSNTEDANHQTVKRHYVCDICNEMFIRRKPLLNHQQEQHNNVPLPFTCKECNQPFVSLDLLQQHLKKVCWNEHRRIAQQCDYCKARFIWPNNLLKHKEIQNHLTNNVQLHYCLLCPKTFFSVADVKEHLGRHCVTPADVKTVESIVNSTWWPNGKKTIQCKLCGSTFENMSKLSEHYSTTANYPTLCASSHSLTNYSITNQKGFELHLDLDSETELDDEQEAGPNRDNINTLYPYSCVMCSKSFMRKYQIAQHQRSMHNYELLQLKCERCIFKTVSQEILDYHRVTQCFNVDKNYECDQCHFKFMWQENLDNHYAIFHTSKEWVTATYVAIYNQSAVPPIQSNNMESASNNDMSNVSKPSSSRNGDTCTMGEKPFKCNLCKMAFPRNADLQAHQITHTNVRLFKCLYCNKGFTRQCKLREHTRLHTGERPYKCTICQKLFNKADYLKLHMRYHTGDKPFKCDICGNTFVCNSYLKKHREQTGHNELFSTPGNNANSIVSEQASTTVANKTLCPICGIYLSCNTSLTLHVKTHTGERPYQCDFCEKAFVRKTELRNHRRKHTGERPYKCTICGKAFTLNCKLKVHNRVHTGERPYKCKLCQRTFTKSDSLRLHMRNHTGENLSRCDICGKAFVLPVYLKRHRIAMGHHAEKV